MSPSHAILLPRLKLLKTQPLHSGELLIGVRRWSYNHFNVTQQRCIRFLTRLCDHAGVKEPGDCYACRWFQNICGENGKWPDPPPLSAWSYVWTPLCNLSLISEEARRPDRSGCSRHFGVIICAGAAEADWLFGCQGEEGKEEKEK